MDVAPYTQPVAKPALTEAIQHYLRDIYKLHAEEGSVSVTSLARRLGVSLTPAGERVALEVIRHHRLLELYLAETLGLRIDEVHDEADRLEHALSEELEARIDRALGFPTHDPHGDPIPNADLQWPGSSATEVADPSRRAKRSPA